ncbi:MAG: CRISPR-associated endonuclease Cas2, partial [Synergistaceae bacterium]
RRSRFMRIMVFFDLPVVSKGDRTIYTHFRKFLIEDGYDMLQFSVYCRIVNGEDAVDKHLQRLMAHLPQKGSVRFLQITDRQYASMKMLVGTRTKKEKYVNVNQTLLF